MKLALNQIVGGFIVFSEPLLINFPDTGKRMWSPSKALFGNQITRRETHLHSSRCSERGATRGAGGWRLLPGSQGASKGQQLKALLSW